MITITQRNGISIGAIHETDRLNAANAHLVKQQLNERLTNSGSHLLLNLSNIRFIDSTGIGALISALKTARQHEATFQLCNIQKDVASLLTLMKLDKVFDIFANEEEVVQ
ncbi:anti-sigma B factor antagonist [Breznakibacter xylanolyticus]|uniref:Anti-sigma factor antagonist n=1 Tax=Breznakibacter xylanolyticus TaxID=990 RepID=A0A2W7NCM7_9BACT|nr:STAS domain-containing protein [Breznakibacter xylanolyticus]MBN2743453.1 STAS domain-containing protein [Marinilabiliaceae bacterium]PZX17918.1 anti-sigma B factor antagonist [Breznakibacter xylanolyticus]